MWSVWQELTGEYLFSAPLNIRIYSLFQAPRYPSPLNWESVNTKIKREEAGESRGGGACNHFFKRPVPIYQLLIGQIGQISQIISTLSKRVVPVTQRDGVRRPRAWNRGINDNFSVGRMFSTRFLAHRSAEEGTKDLPCELGAWKRYFCNPVDRLRSCLITKWQWQNSRKKLSTCSSPDSHYL